MLTPCRVSVPESWSHSLAKLPGMVSPNDVTDDPENGWLKSTRPNNAPGELAGHGDH